MYDWSGCPAGFFDLYMETGQVKKVPTASEPVLVEVWVASTFAASAVQEECKEASRRPIYDVLKQIRGLCGDQPACVIFLSDDGRNDAVAWSAAVTLLIKQLKKEKLLACSVLYAATGDEITRELKDLSDVLVCGQSNPRQDKADVQIRSKISQLPSALIRYIGSAE
ncbi:MAG: hypothetical protein E7447_00715 [Ruminococcaceae bacterium]|nr:hypothetical protein [Oscillospiraceae bacterium]